MTGHNTNLRSQRQSEDTQLTHREQECLHYASQGFSIKETAVIMRIHPCTVKWHRSNLLSKLGCQTIFRAVRKYDFSSDNSALGALTILTPSRAYGGC